MGRRQRLLPGDFSMPRSGQTQAPVFQSRPDRGWVTGMVYDRPSRGDREQPTLRLPVRPHAWRHAAASAPEHSYVAGTPALGSTHTSRSPRTAAQRQEQRQPRPIQNRHAAGAPRNHAQQGPSAAGTKCTGAVRRPISACDCDGTPRTHSGPCRRSGRTGTCPHGTDHEPSRPPAQQGGRRGSSQWEGHVERFGSRRAAARWHSAGPSGTGDWRGGYPNSALKHCGFVSTVGGSRRTR